MALFDLEKAETISLKFGEILDRESAAGTEPVCILFGLLMASQVFLDDSPQKTRPATFVDLQDAVGNCIESLLRAQAASDVTPPEKEPTLQ